MSLGGWIAALILGIVLVLVAPMVPPPGGRIVKIIGIVLLVVALILFVLWLVGLLAGGTAAVGSVLLAGA